MLESVLRPTPHSRPADLQAEGRTLSSAKQTLIVGATERVTSTRIREADKFCLVPGCAGTLRI
jgi:hypothetical protein